MIRYGLIVSIWNENRRQDEVLIILELNNRQQDINHLLELYATKYGFDRSKLGGVITQIVQFDL